MNYELSDWIDQRIGLHYRIITTETNQYKCFIIERINFNWEYYVAVGHELYKKHSAIFGTDSIPIFNDLQEAKEFCDKRLKTILKRMSFA